MQKELTLAATAAVALLVVALAPGGGAQDVTATTGAPSIAISVVYIDFGIQGDPNDDCAYIEMSNPGGGVSVGDLRILRANRPGNICSDIQPGTRISSGDAAELQTTGTQVTNPTMTLKFQDQDGNGRYDYNDTLYLDTFNGAGLQPTNFQGSGSRAIRLSAAGGKSAGTMVFSSDPDSYATGASAQVLSSASIAFLDRDGNSAWSEADYAFLLPQTAPGLAAGSLIPAGAMRASSNNPNGAFGTKTGAPGASTTTASSTTATDTTTDDLTFSFTTTSSTTSFSSTTSSSPPIAGHGGGRTAKPSASTPGIGLAGLGAGLALAAVAVRRKLA